MLGPGHLQKSERALVEAQRRVLRAEAVGVGDVPARLGDQTDHN